MRLNPWKIEIVPWKLEGEEKSVFDAVSQHVADTARVGWYIAFIAGAFWLDSFDLMHPETSYIIGSVLFFPIYFALSRVATMIGDKAGERAIYDLRRRRGGWL